MLASAPLAVFLTSGETSDMNFVSSVVTHRFVDSSRGNRCKHFHYSGSELFCILVVLKAAHPCLLHEPCGDVEVVSLKLC